MRVTLLLALLALPPSLPAAAAPDTRPQILILGTYHMANPGRDIYNSHADDMLADKRQKEIAQLIDVLKRFHPTKIAVEASVGSTKVTQRYADYLAGRYALTADETEQIGFRLASALGHPAIYPVDEEGDFPYERVLNYAKANGLTAQFDALQASMGARVKEQDEFLKAHTVLETLEYMNADARVASDVALYYAFVPFADPDEYAGPDLLAMWYQRNIRIYHNISALLAAPEERILVVYGAGHLGWLRQDVANDARVRLRTLAELSAAH